MRTPTDRRGRGFGSQSTPTSFGRGSGASGRGRGSSSRDLIPETVVELGRFLHACEGEAICGLTQSKVPYFNAPIFTENKTQVGKIEEIFGPISKVMVTIKLLEGVQATSYSPGDTFHISPDKLLSLERFLPQQNSSTVRNKRKTFPSSQGRGQNQSRGGGRGRGRGRAIFSKR